MAPKTIRFLPFGTICTFTKEESVLEVALKHKIDLPHSCGGMGSCTTCLVLVVRASGDLPERTEIEREIAEMRGYADNERLACQLPPRGDFILRIPFVPGTEDADDT